MSAYFESSDPLFEQFVDTTAPPERIASGFTWTEGPVWLNDALYFNDIPAKRMMKWTEAEGVSVALPNSEFANGNTLDGKGMMISCEHGGRRVLRRLNPEDAKSVETIAQSYDGMRLNSPNDVIVHKDGSIWFTDPPYGINCDIEGYAADSEIKGNHVYRVDADGSIKIVATDFDKPNGLAFSPDQQQIYIADSGAILGASFPDMDRSLPHHVRRFDIVDNELTKGCVFYIVEPGVPDGLRVDHEGYVWCSAMDGIHCLTPEATLIGKIRLPSPTANLCFGGRGGQDMFITSSDSVYRVHSTRRDAAHIQ